MAAAVAIESASVTSSSRGRPPSRAASSRPRAASRAPTRTLHPLLGELTGDMQADTAGRAGDQRSRSLGHIHDARSWPAHASQGACDQQRPMGRRYADSAVFGANRAGSCLALLQLTALSEGSMSGTSTRLSSVPRRPFAALAAMVVVAALGASIPGGAAGAKPRTGRSPSGKAPGGPGHRPTSTRLARTASALRVTAPRRSGSRSLAECCRTCSVRRSRTRM